MNGTGEDPRGAARARAAGALLAALLACAAAGAPEPVPPAAPGPDAGAGLPGEPGTEPELEEDWDLGPVSAAAQRMLDRVRGSVVQIRGFFGTHRAEAFHGSGFVAAPGGLVVTNYHVISRAALDPWNYRLEYLTDEGQAGKLAILAIDVAHDLALLRADGFAPAPLPLRTTVPARGDRAYAIGFPLNLGLVITEGIANGRIENSYSPRLHYAGAMNPGMSGGPALDSRGRVFGVNVAFSTLGQLVSFLVPAELIEALLEAAESPREAGSLHAEVRRQLVAHQAGLLKALPLEFPTQTSAGYALPAELAPFVECTATRGDAPSRRVRLQSVSCRAAAEVAARSGLATGDFQFRHQVMIGADLEPLRFSEQLRQVANAARTVPGSPLHVTPYGCRTTTVLLNGFSAEVAMCVRSYLLFEGLYDVGMTVVSRNRPQRGFVSTLTLRGMEFAIAMEFSRRYLQAMRWSR